VGDFYNRGGGALTTTTINATTITADDLEIDSGTLSIDETNNRVGVGLTTPKTALTVEGPVTVKEQSNADGDTAAYGQIWVKNTTPNQLFFTTDAGDDVQITSGTSIASPATAVSMTNGSDNRIATATGAAALNGEANLTFDGNTLTVTDAVSDTSAGTFIAVDVNFDKTGNSTSDNTMIGINLDMDNTSATGGNNEMVGIKVTPTLTHASGTGTATCKGLEIVATGATATPQQETVRAIDIIATGAETNQGIFMKVDNGTGPDIKMISSANSADSATITTGANGEFTIATTDADAALAHINLEPDGDVIIKGTTPKLIIGDAGEEDTMLVFDGHAQDFRIGLDDGTDTLEIGQGSSHGSNTAIAVNSSGQVTTFNIPAAAVAQASDHIIFLDGGATGAPKAESIDDFLTAIAGSGISVSSSQLTASGGGSAADDLNLILHMSTFS